MKYDYIVDGAIHAVAGPLIKLKISEVLSRENDSYWENTVVPIMKKYEFYHQLADAKTIMGYDFTACMFLLFPYYKDKGGNVIELPGLSNKFMSFYQLTEKQISDIKYIRYMRNKGSHGNSFGAYTEELKKVIDNEESDELIEDDETGSKAKNFLNKIRDALKPLDTEVVTKMKTYFEQLSNALISDIEKGDSIKTVPRAVEVPKSLPWYEAPNVPPIPGNVPWKTEARDKMIWPSEYADRLKEMQNANTGNSGTQQLNAQPENSGIKSIFKKIFG